MLDLPTATLLLGIATLLVTGYIAIQQWLTAKRKLRLDVFDRRLPVFEDAMSFTEIVSTKENITLEEVQKFKFATKSVRFLFNRQTQDYCDKLYMEAFAVHRGKQQSTTCEPWGICTMPTTILRAGHLIGSDRMWPRPCPDCAAMSHHS